MTIKEAVFQVIHRLNRATGIKIFREVKKIHAWGDQAILRHIIGQTINLQPGYCERSFFSDSDKCLFMQSDGYFELYDPAKHGRFERRSQKLQALGTMASGIAHDLNNILTPIVINMELALLDLPQDSPLIPYLETALSAAHRGKELVGQIITFSRQKELAPGGPMRKPKENRTVVGGRERVLLVEDDTVQVETLQKALKKLGYEVTGMDNGLEALALLRKNPANFDVVVTDQTMPEITGLQLAEEVLKVHPEIPVILCTGFSEEANPERARALGITRFMMKPFTIRDMALAIRQALRQRPNPAPVNRSG